MKFINKGIILNIIVLSVFILSAFSLAPKTTTPSIFGPLQICAADKVDPTDTGLSCVRKSGDCPDGFVTLVDALAADAFILNGNNASKGALQNSLAKSYGTEGLYNTCINTSYTKVFTIFASGTSQQAGADPSFDLPALAGSDIPRVCEPGSFPDEADASTGPNLPNPSFGCCISGYNFVTNPPGDALNPNPDAFQKDNNSGCCPTVNGLEARYWNGGKCTFDREGNQPIDTSNSSKGYPNNSQAPIPIYGKTLGKKSSVDGGAYLQPAKADPDKFICPVGSACIADPASNTYGSSLGPDGKEKGLPSCSAVAVTGDSSTNSSKIKCYADGEFIGTISQNGQKLVRKCDVTSSTFYVDVVACNNSLSDELACRGTGASQTNYDLCCKCRIAGGVWTGIGCTDTSPLGIITGIIRIVFGVVGGIALIQLIIAGIMYQTGDEARIKSARESIIKTLTGLAVLVFSILILRIIGINILDVLPVGSV